MDGSTGDQMEIGKVGVDAARIQRQHRSPGVIDGSKYTPASRCNLVRGRPCMGINASIHLVYVQNSWCDSGFSEMNRGKRGRKIGSKVCDLDVKWFEIDIYYSYTALSTKLVMIAAKESDWSITRPVIDSLPSKQTHSTVYIVR